MASKNLKEYVVLADVVNVTNGKKANGRPAVARVLRGATINAPETNQSVQELLSMGGICLKSELVATMKSLRERGGARRPTVTRVDVKKGDRAFRITAAGTALTLAASDDLPEQPVDGVLPIEPTELDLTTTV